MARARQGLPTVTVTKPRTTVTDHGLPKGPFRALDQLREHCRDSVSEVLCRNNLRDWRQLIDLDTVQGHDQFLGLSKRNPVGRSPCAASLSDTFANVERDTPGRALHLILEVRLSTGELSDYLTDLPVEGKRGSIHVEPMHVIPAPSLLHSTLLRLARSVVRGPWPVNRRFVTVTVTVTVLMARGRVMFVYDTTRKGVGGFRTLWRSGEAVATQFRPGTS